MNNEDNNVPCRHLCSDEALLYVRSCVKDAIKKNRNRANLNLHFPFIPSVVLSGWKELLKDAGLWKEMKSGSLKLTVCVSNASRLDVLLGPPEEWREVPVYTGTLYDGTYSLHNMEKIALVFTPTSLKISLFSHRCNKHGVMVF